MSHVDVKPLGFGQEEDQLRDNEQNSCKIVKLADELIRALDAESNEHMQQISAEEKLRNS